MKVIWEQGNEAKLTEEKRENMNKLIGLNNIPIREKVSLVIDDWCCLQIKRLHKEYPNTEWLAVCKVKPQWEGVFLMTDMLFPWQKWVGGEVETTEEWMERLTKELINRGEKMTDWNCVLHSHHHMGVFRSGTDDKARLSLNDWRQLAWAVVTAYDKDTVSYKGCLNFYKPYNIEIDVDVREIYDTPVKYVWLQEKYKDYIEKVRDSEANFYQFLLDTNKEYIDSITDKPSYSGVLDYLWVDISEELNENYNKLKDKIGNPELVEYMKQLWDKANELAVNEINTDWRYTDMLVEYDAFVNWSNNLMTQLEEHRKQPIVQTTLNSFGSASLFSQSSYPLNRDLEDDYGYGYHLYEFTSPQYAESYVRQMFGIDKETPMKVGDDWERMAWSNEDWDYIYVEDWATMMWC